MPNFIKAWIPPLVILACISWFIFRFFTTEDPTTRWCSNCNTYHSINDQTIEEIWCNNCNTWHLPKDESNNQIIR